MSPRALLGRGAVVALICTRCQEQPGVPRREHAQRVFCADCAARPPLVDWEHPPEAPERLTPDDLEEMTERATVLAGRTPAEPTANGAGFAADRHAGRRYDLAKLIADADVEPPWRVEPILADGHLTVLASRGGEGKTWGGLGFAGGVAYSSIIAGLRCEGGRAVIFDAENGPYVLGSRLKALDPGLPDDRVAIYDAAGLSLASAPDLAWMLGVIREERANLVVLDSLRTLAPGVAENDNDEMAPVIIGAKNLARQSGAAVLLLHNRGHDLSKDFRGATAIRDQADVVFVLERDEKDPEARTRRRLRCSKCRIAPEPEDRWFKIETWHGRVTLAEAEPFADESRTRAPSAAEQMLDRVIAHLRATGGDTRAQTSLTLTGEKSHGTVRRALELSAKRKVIEEADGRWQIVTEGVAKPDLATLATPGTGGGGGPRPFKGGLATPGQPEVATPADDDALTRAEQLVARYPDEATP